jgi:hypothetical protein
MFSFIFIMAISIIAVIFAVLGVLIASGRARGRRVAEPGNDGDKETGWRTCTYCGTRNRKDRTKCESCGASL